MTTKTPEMNAPRPVDIPTYQIFYPTPSELGDPSKSKSGVFFKKNPTFGELNDSALLKVRIHWKPNIKQLHYTICLV